jgi:hypothetical protein
VNLPLIHNTNLPLVSTRNIYKQSTVSNLSFLSDYTIKTVERTFSLNKEYQTIKLFSKYNIEKHKQNFFFYTYRTCQSSR